MERKKIIKDLGTLSDQILLFGGVYSNWQALVKMRQIAEMLRIPPGRILCTGDLAGYCAQPEECVQEIMDWGIHSIAGNVEIQLREGRDDCGCDFKLGGRCDTFSRQWYPYARSNLSARSITWMDGLPDFIQFQYAGLKAVVVHGSWYETSEYIFGSTPWEVKRNNFTVAGADIIIAGHCGLPFAQQRDGKYWLNPGVIGMPANDGTTRVWYMILDHSENGAIIFKHHSFQYDCEQAAKLMERHHLPPEYARTLTTGLWDNCEILPREETNLRGRAIRLD